MLHFHCHSISMRNISQLLRNMSFFRHGDQEITFFFRHAMGEFPRPAFQLEHSVSYHKCLFYWLLITRYSNFSYDFLCILHGIWNYKLYRSTSETREVISINRRNNPCIYEHKGYS